MTEEKPRAPQIARRCSICAIDWPDTGLYKTCPGCQDSDGTSRCRDVKPLPEDEALSMKLHFEFDRFYEEWDEEHDSARLVPDPEVIYEPENLAQSRE